MDVTSPSTAAMARPGNSAMAVGHLAKAAVAEARASGAELPRNAQGLAASTIARGGDPASVFTPYLPPAPVPDEPPVVEDPPVVDAPTDAGDPAVGAPPVAEEGDGAAAPPEETPEVDLALAGYADALAALGGDGGLTAAETALALLEGAAGAAA